MIWNRRLLGVPALLMLFCFTAASLAQVQEDHLSTVVTVCEILSHPLQFNGKTVTIRDSEIGSTKGAWLAGYECPGIFVTEGYVWPSLVTLEMPPI